MITSDSPLALGGEVELNVKMKPLPGVQTWVVRVTELARPIGRSQLEKSFDQRQATTKATLEVDARRDG